MTEIDEKYLSPDFRVTIQHFYDLPPEGLTDEFLDELLTLNEVVEDLRQALKYSSIAEAAREGRLRTIAKGGTSEYTALYLTTRRWVWQAIEINQIRPRWK